MPKLEKMLEMAKRMDRRTKIVCSVVGSLGVLSAILGFSAERTKLTPYTILVYGYECIYPQNPALGLGVSAAIFLLAAQVIFSVAGSCCGFCNSSRSIPSKTKRKTGIACAVASWILAVIAWALLIQGAAWNANVVRMTAPNCQYLKDGVFAGAGVLTLAATALGIVSLIMLGRQPAEAVAHAGGGYAQAPQTNHPQSPPAAHAAAQASGTATAPNQHLRPQVECPPSAAACPPSKPSEQAPPLGVAADQPQVALPQAQVPNDTPQYPVPTPASQAGEEITVVPMPFTGTPAPPRNSLSAVMRNELTKQGIRLAAKVVEQALLSDNTATTSIFSMMTDSTGGDVQDTNCGDAAA